MATVELSHRIEQGNIVILEYFETFEGINSRKRFEIEIVGKSLVIRSYAVNPSLNSINNYAGFGLGEIGNSNVARAIQVPYMKTSTVSVVNNNIFVSNYIDWTKSSSNQRPLKNGPSLNGNSFSNSFSSQYVPGQNGVYSSFNETSYITVSRDIKDTFMNVNRQKSPYRDSLNNKLSVHMALINHQRYIDNSNPAGRFYPNAREIIRKLSDYGVRDLFFTLHSSQSLNNGLLYPNICPPSSWYGSIADLVTLRDTALSQGYYFAPIHDNRMDMFQGSPYWNGYCDSNRIPVSVPGVFPISLNQDGTCKVSGWHSSSVGNGDYFYVIPSDKLLDYAVPEMQCINNFIDSNAHYLDVSSKVSFNELIDYSESNSLSRTIGQGIQNIIELNDFVYQSIQGPISAEGGEHALDTIDTLIAGKVDSFNREIFGREDAPIIPDFELIVSKPLMVGRGMGSYERWVIEPGNSGWIQKLNFSKFIRDKSDKYRATTIAFGHTGFYDDQFLWLDANSTNLNEFYNYLVKEYYIFSEMQRLYLESEVNSIEYYKDGVFRDLSGILVSFATQAEQNTYFKDNTKLKITYKNGLEVFINRDAGQVWQITVNNKIYYLPPNAWFATHPYSGLLVYSALVDSNGNPDPLGHRVDYAKTSSYTMANGRGIPTSFDNGAIQTTYLKVVKPDEWNLLEEEDGRFRISLAPSCGDNICNGGETCSTCSIDCLICNGEPSGRPYGLNVTSLSSSSLKLNWVDNSTGEDGFKIGYKKSFSQTWNTVEGANNLPPGTIEFTQNGLEANTAYDYRVASFNEFGNSEWSDIASGTTKGSSNNIGGSSGGGSGGGGGGGGAGGIVPGFVTRNQCADFIDNDFDGLIDYPEDTGCTSSNGNSEEEYVYRTEDSNGYSEDGDYSEEKVRFNPVLLSFMIILVLGIVFISFIIIRLLRAHNRFRQMSNQIG